MCMRRCIDIRTDKCMGRCIDILPCMSTLMPACMPNHKFYDMLRWQASFVPAYALGDGHTNMHVYAHMTIHLFVHLAMCTPARMYDSPDMSTKHI